MVKQERAQQTRRSLILAAAAVFDEFGYAGTSLTRVVANAGVTMGALTFHFPTKPQLADAVTRYGAAAVRASLQRRAAQAPPGIQGVIDLTHTLAGLLEQDATVRAAARLAREVASSAPHWRAAWMPVLGEHLDRTHEAGLPPTEAVRRAVTVLVEHLVAGSEAVSQSACPEWREEGAGPREQLAAIWELLLSGALSEVRAGEFDPHGRH
ncbi:TetR/AcrR family transcriptional regulator [Streptomyces sp. HNM0574]|uniref:TetR family transcriptional regulator n=1 Tax=Streptomyces sp. HNM0574 TaxID=2714954 RepID=UPI00146F0DBE|nr:TetR/AcrR family transcriptional regulator [Streptomyces sp. HNM0574]